MEDGKRALLLKAKEGSSKAWREIVKIYLPIVKSIARDYFVPHMDYEDLVQEGLLALFKAVNSFDVNKGVKFESFLEMCLRRQFTDVLRKATRQKEIPVNKYVSIEEKPGLSLWREKEDWESMDFDINLKLSDLENKVLSKYLEGKTYTEIAQELGCTLKVVDNALQRIKRKLRKTFDSQ
ncbi:MAG: sigma-70 family RNA polymerase sigma factor [Synergistetes bacterium]|nr:MAG: RNA polymerase, sigma-24 subunit, ECF subfamily [bacterium 42_11]MBC7332609.1 sigma-70 family RNA polymerase sigma factor [Synergistota bacterium]MDK2871708.1 polymerase sporulation-specific sigma factor [bacterium]